MSAAECRVDIKEFSRWHNFPPLSLDHDEWSRQIGWYMLQVLNGNYEAHIEYKGKEKLFFLLLVNFVAQKLINSSLMSTV